MPIGNMFPIFLRLRTTLLIPVVQTKVEKLKSLVIKVRNRAKIRNRYNQAPHLTQDTNEKVTTSQLDISNESQEVSPFPAGIETDAHESITKT